jgi:hypothetical protein
MPSPSPSQRRAKDEAVEATAVLASAATQQGTSTTFTYGWAPAREIPGAARGVDQIRLAATIQQSMFKFDLNGAAVDKTRSSAPDDPDLAFMFQRARERNQVADLKMTLSSHNDAFKLTLRESDSVYTRDADVPGKQALGPQPDAPGRASHQRLDVSIYKSNWFGLSGHAAHIQVDPTYERFALLPRPNRGKKDEFSHVDRKAIVLGTDVRVGPVTLGISQSEAEKLSDIQRPTSTAQAYMATFDLSDLRHRVGDLRAAPLWTLLPTAVYAGFIDSSYVLKHPEHKLPDQMGVYNVGASWTAENLYGNVNLYTYGLDSRRSAAASYDSSGTGFSGNIGAWGERWTADFGLSTFRSDELAPLSHTTSTSLDVSVSTTYRPDGLPDVSAVGTYGQYGYEGASTDTRAEATYWHAIAGLNFAKFLWPVSTHSGDERERALLSRDAEVRSLKLIYKVEFKDLRHSATSSEHVGAVVFRNPF